MITTRRVAIAIACALASGCADKQLTPTASKLSPKMTLQLSAIAPSQSAGAAWLLVAALYRDPDDTNEFQPLAFKFASLTQGTITVTLPVDLSACISANASRGKDGCTMYVGAALLADTLAISDSTRNVLGEAFDSAIPLGPFDVVPGRTPVIPTIDLSMTRFAVVRWSGDDALRLGGAATPNGFTTGIAGNASAVSGVASGSGAPTLFALTRGFNFTNTDDPLQFQQNFPQLAIYQNGSWRRVSGPPQTPVSGTNDYNDVSALSLSEVYMSSTTGLFKYDGTSISKVAAIPDTLFSVASVTAGTTKSVIAGGNNGVVWIGNTQTWQRYTVPSTNRIDGVCITGPSEAFAASSQGGGLFRFDGTAWTSVPSTLTGGKLDLQCPSAGQAFVITSGGIPLRWSGTAWTQLPGPGLPGRQMRLGVATANEVYAYGDSAGVDRVYVRFTGTAWTQVGRLRFTMGGGRLWGVPGGGAAYVVGGLGRVERVTPNNVSVVSFQPSLRDVSMTSATSAFVVGWPSVLARWDGTQWQADAPPSGTPANRMMQGVWSDGPSNAWAVGELSTVLRWGGSSWSIVSDSLRPAAIRDGYNAVWGVGSDVWAVGNSTILHCRSASSCANESSGASSALLAVWGTSATNVLAAGDNGRIIRFDGTTWSAMNSPTTRALARISGTGPNDVWAVGDSVLLHYNGSQWSNVPMTGDLAWIRSHVPNATERAANGIFRGMTSMALWARGPREVYLGGQYGGMVRFDGSGWFEVNSGRYLRRLLSMAGLAGSNACALAVTEAQSDVPGPTLWRGAGPTGCMASSMQAVVSWP